MLGEGGGVVGSVNLRGLEYKYGLISLSFSFCSDYIYSLSVYLLL
jgi:hypothetical protein